MALGDNTFYEFLNFRLHVNKQQLDKNGEPVQLAPKTFQLLLLLVQKSGQLVKKEDIFNQLWADSFVEEANLTQNIYVLRKILGQGPNGQSYIKTISKQGYLFTLEPEEIYLKKEQSVESVGMNLADRRSFSADKINLPINQSGFEEPKRLTSEEKLFSEDKTEAFVPLRSATASERGKKVLTSAVLLISLLFLGIIAAGTTIYYSHHKTAQQASSSDIKSVAVLPFNSIGEEVNKAKLGLGMADAVITQLSKLQIIEVRPTSTIFRYAGQPAPNPVFIGKELEVDAVLDGTVQTDGERVKASVQLIRVSDGKSLWAETFNEKASDIFAIQDLISKRLVAALSLKLTPQQEQKLAARGTTNNAAYQAYQLGVYFWNKRSKDDLLRAVRYFQQAIELDPNYAQGYAGLADCYSLLGYYGFANVGEMKEKAKITAEKALALNNDLPEAYAALGIAHVLKNENPSKALELHARAVELAPYNASVRHRYGMTLYWNGKLDEAIEQMRSAREYDPPSPGINGALCKILIRQRNFTDAVQQCEKFVEISPGILNSRVSLARAYFYYGRRSDAVNQLQIQIDSGNQEEMISTLGKLAYFYAKLGRAEEAEKIYADLKQEFGKDPQQAGDLALISFELGKKEEALFYFKEMLKSFGEYADLSLSLTYDPFWDDMKKDPQFATLFPKANHPGGVTSANL
jgi:TolB-like protein/DNA-binding winged helix-turn-helix (wHTH) protein/Flp pilus assembly protein TadD